jgi:predicted RNA binding protein YcfA (HicA-like mRNA interferase family)
MGRLSGYKYREINSKLKKFGFGFYRQAAGSHEIWYNEATDRYTLFQIIPETCQKGPCMPF